MHFSHTWITIPLIGAFIGWITNLIAVRMLFRPRREVRFGPFFSIQGVFPKRQRVLAEKIGAIVATELFSMRDIAASIKEKASSDEVLDGLIEHLKQALRTKIPEAFPMAAMFLTSELIDSLAVRFKPDLCKIIEALSAKVGASLESSFNVAAIVQEKVTSFSSEKLEKLILDIMKRELLFVEYIGGVLGFLIGISQVALTFV